MLWIIITAIIIGIFVFIIFSLLKANSPYDQAVNNFEQEKFISQHKKNKFRK